MPTLALQKPLGLRCAHQPSGASTAHVRGELILLRSPSKWLAQTAAPRLRVFHPISVNGKACQRQVDVCWQLLFCCLGMAGPASCRMIHGIISKHLRGTLSLSLATVWCPLPALRFSRCAAEGQGSHVVASNLALMQLADLFRPTDASTILCLQGVDKRMLK